MRIVLLGAPGAGKGTQCMRIADKYGLLHLSSGDILRQERAGNTELGRKASSYMDSGALVPDVLVVQMMVAAISKVPQGGFVLDGFPRTIDQAVELDKSLAAGNPRIDIVLNLQVDDKVIAQRMTGRRSCPKCGAVYHTENLKPRIEGICDKDGSELTQRSDDSSEVVASRLEHYHQLTEPLVEYYRKNNMVYDIDANADLDSITASIFERLDVFANP